MKAQKYLEYQIKFSKDKATGLIAAEVPSLEIANDGKDKSEALKNIKDMISFHVECLIEEGQNIPQEKSKGEGIYLRIKWPERAA